MWNCRTSREAHKSERGYSLSATAVKTDDCGSDKSVPKCPHDGMSMVSHTRASVPLKVALAMLRSKKPLLSRTTSFRPRGETERTHMSDPQIPGLGPYLRERRIARGFSLRKFAGLLEVSPTYLSRIEQEKTDAQLTARLARRAAELLGENADEMIARTGRVPDDLPTIIRSEPEAMPELLRAAQGLTAEKLRRLAEEARRMRDQEDQ